MDPRANGWWSQFEHFANPVEQWSVLPSFMIGEFLFVACAVARIPIWTAMRSIWPFYGAAIVVLGLVTYIPAISLWLPSVFR